MHSSEPTTLLRERVKNLNTDILVLTELVESGEYSDESRESLDAKISESSVIMDEIGILENNREIRDNRIIRMYLLYALLMVGGTIVAVVIIS